ncbi:hypothetical protein DASC09_012470 [Saccharomycopsis crataegensis]|uniref:Uncharacterized protein n=1 Tax=Saccharomycopsis crataegensis TaxID=43959 RepID=A0AAV5QH18_9ASCO|nr:hypothetical protein DASC09_012470 [Saccharomycopsis crataegensis]
MGNNSEINLFGKELKEKWMEEAQIVDLKGIRNHNIFLEFSNIYVRMLGRPGLLSQLNSTQFNSFL